MIAYMTLSLVKVMITVGGGPIPHQRQMAGQQCLKIKNQYLFFKTVLHHVTQVTWLSYAFKLHIPFQHKTDCNLISYKHYFHFLIIILMSTVTNNLSVYCIQCTTIMSVVEKRGQVCILFTLS